MLEENEEESFMHWIYHRKHFSESGNGEAAKRKKSTLLKRICIMFINVHYYSLDSTALYSLPLTQVLVSLYLSSKWRRKNWNNFLPTTLPCTGTVCNHVFTKNYSLKLKIFMLISWHNTVRLLLCVCVSMAFIAGIRLKLFSHFTHIHTIDELLFCTYQHLKIKEGEEITFVAIYTT